MLKIAKTKTKKAQSDKKKIYKYMHTKNPRRILTIKQNWYHFHKTLCCVCVYQLILRDTCAHETRKASSPAPPRWQTEWWLFVEYFVHLIIVTLSRLLNFSIKMFWMRATCFRSLPLFACFSSLPTRFSGFVHVKIVSQTTHSLPLTFHSLD